MKIDIGIPTILGARSRGITRPSYNNTGGILYNITRLEGGIAFVPSVCQESFALGGLWPVR